MSPNITVDVEFDMKAWLDIEQARLDNASEEMANDVLTRAKMNAPVDSGALVDSGRVVKQSDGSYEVVFGNSRVKYAKIREYINKKNPQTVKYLEKAGETVKKGNTNKYFR